MKKLSKVITVVGIAGGAVSEDGRTVVIELQMIDRKVLPFEFPRGIADKLSSAAARLVSEARKRSGSTDEAASAAGALAVTPNMLSFQAAADGSHSLIVVRPTSGPPLSIVVDPQDFQGIRDQLDNTERLMLSRRSRPN